jgi:hypothetical protein
LILIIFWVWSWWFWSLLYVWFTSHVHW